MRTAGIILFCLGGALIFATTLALSRGKPDEKFSGAEVFDIFLLGGAIGFFRDLYHGISEGLRDRSSSAFHLVVLFAASLTIFSIGAGLWVVSGFPQSGEMDKQGGQVEQPGGPSAARAEPEPEADALPSNGEGGNSPDKHARD